MYIFKAPAQTGKTVMAQRYSFWTLRDALNSCFLFGGERDVMSVAANYKPSLFKIIDTMADNVSATDDKKTTDGSCSSFVFNGKEVSQKCAKFCGGNFVDFSNNIYLFETLSTEFTDKCLADEDRSFFKGLINYVGLCNSYYIDMPCLIDALIVLGVKPVDIRIVKISCTYDSNIRSWYAIYDHTNYSFGYVCGDTISLFKFDSDMFQGFPYLMLGESSIITPKGVIINGVKKPLTVYMGSNGKEKVSLPVDLTKLIPSMGACWIDSITQYVMSCSGQGSSIRGGVGTFLLDALMSSNTSDAIGIYTPVYDSNDDDPLGRLNLDGYTTGGVFIRKTGPYFDSTKEDANGIFISSRNAYHISKDIVMTDRQQLLPLVYKGRVYGAIAWYDVATGSIGVYSTADRFNLDSRLNKSLRNQFESDGGTTGLQNFGGTQNIMPQVVLHFEKHDPIVRL